MGTLRTTPFAETRHVMEDTFDRLKDGMHRILNRVTTKADGSPSRVHTWSTRATDAVKAHPYAAVGVAIALGYAIVRIARR